MDEARRALKVRENQIRRVAARQGLAFSRSRRRDPRALDYGRYQLVRGEEVVLETRDLDAVERFLRGESENPR